MTVVLLAEGATETALKNRIKEFLDERAQIEGKPRVRFQTRKIEYLDAEKLRDEVTLELSRKQVTAVVGLVDVYPQFKDAEAAKKFLRQAVGEETRFYPHAAQYDVEAWLLPYWDSICDRIHVNQKKPGANPEMVNKTRPPSRVLKELYRRAKPKPREYVKQIEMEIILRNKDLMIAASQCPGFKSFLNTLLTLSNLTPL